MHGSFIIGLKEMIINKYDQDIWLEVLEHAGFEPNYRPLSNQEVNDEEAIVLVKAAIKKLNLGERAFGEIFGRFWIHQFAREKYFAFFSAYKSFKEFLMQINELHNRLTANLKRANPPRFEIRWENPFTAIIFYISKRQMVHIAVGLLKALGEYYHEDIQVFKIESNQIKILFKS